MFCRVCKPFVILLAGFACSPLFSAEPACSATAYRQFDFWKGNWEVTANGQLVGRNRIVLSHQGCLLEEQWHSSRGGTGSSMNFYDPAAGLWRQLWVSGGTIINIAGGLQDVSMVLEGTVTYTADARQLPFRGMWTPLEDGRVRQFFEEFRDGKWQVWFEGFYSKVLE